MSPHVRPRTISALAALATLLIAAFPTGHADESVVALPDLAIVSMTTDPPVPEAWTFSDVVVNITNQGVADIDDWFRVSLAISDGIELWWTVPGLATGDHKVLNAMRWFDEGDFTAHVVLDSAETVAESDESNNAHTLHFTVGDPQPDLRAGEIFVFVAAPDEGPDVGFPSVIRDGETRTLHFTVYNQGTRAAGPAEVVVKVDGSLLATRQTSPDPEEPFWYGQDFQVDWVATEGVHDITVEVDPADSIAEKSEDNNVATKTVHVIAADAPAPDLKVVNVWSTDPIYVGGGYTIIAEVQNIGGAPAGAFASELWTPIGSTSVELPGLGADQTFRLTLSGTVPTHGLELWEDQMYFHVAIDHRWDVDEDEELNNHQYGSMQVLAPDLVVAEAYFADGSPAPGEDAELVVTIWNVGSASTSGHVAARVDTWFNAPAVVSVPALPVDGSFTFRVPIRIEYPGYITAQIEIDPDRRLVESGPRNNLRSVEHVFESDVEIQEFWVYGNRWLGSPHDIQVVVGNQGNLAAAGYEVRLEIEGEYHDSVWIERTDVYNTTEVHFRWTPLLDGHTMPGTYHIRVLVDRCNDLGESRTEWQESELFVRMGATPLGV